MASRPAQATSASDIATCSDTRACRRRDPRSPATRPAPRIASIGSAREPISAGTSPTASAVASDTAVAKPSTASEGDGSTGRSRAPGNAIAIIARAPPYATASSGQPAHRREHHALHQRLREQPSTRRAQRGPDGELDPPAETAREQQVRQVGAGDHQHGRRDGEQDDQWRRELLAHVVDAGRRRHHADHLIRDPRAILGREIRQRRQPLAQERGDAWRDLLAPCARTRAADHVKPVAVGVATRRPSGWSSGSLAIGSQISGGLGLSASP